MPDHENNKIGFIGATSYIVGTIIGSGLFVSPTAILKQSGSVGLSLCVWLLSGLFTVVAGMVYVELGTSIRESGSEFAYISYVGWYPLAFSFVWLTTLVSNSCGMAILADTFGEYVMQAMEPISCLTDSDKLWFKRLTGYLLIFLLTWANFFSLKKYAARIQIVITIAKMLSVALIIGTGFYFLIFKGRTQHFVDGNLWKGSNFDAESIVLAIYAGNWAYGGYDTLNYGAEEISNYRRTLPIAVVGGVITTMFIYLTANISYFVILSPEAMVGSVAVASDFSKETLGDFYYAMPAIVGILMIGTLNSDIFTSSRYMFAAARKGQMPTCWALVNEKTNSPRVSIFYHSFFAIAISFLGSVDKLINYMTVCNLLQQATAVAALIWIRYKGTTVHREAIRFPIAIPIAFFIFCIALIVIPLVKEPITTAVGLGCAIVGIVAYYIFVKPKRKLRPLLWLDEWSTKLSQLVFWAVMEELDEQKNEHIPTISETLEKSKL
uniref:Uncharacterized protein n=1 Tax=Plectus sambesii TaxID=2011161 RepID=A0A914W6L6_9BILA